MLQRTPAYGRPGERRWRPRALLAVLLAAVAGAFLWALFVGLLWAMWVGRAYVIVAACILAALAVVAYAAHLAIKPDRRSKVLAVCIIGALTALILWVLPR